MDKSDQTVTHIVLASRAYSKEEGKGMHAVLNEKGSMTYRLAGSCVAFDNKDDVTQMERRVADLLKETFKHRLPKPPVEDDPMDGDDYFGLDKKQDSDEDR